VEHPVRQPMRGRAVVPDKLGERLLVAVAGRRDELAVGTMT
jgi:hypothetical protein